MRKNIFYFSILALMSVNSFAQNTQTTLVPVAGGTVKKDNTNTHTDMTAHTGVSYGFCTFDLSTIPANAVVTQVALSAQINTLNQPSMGHQAVVVYKDTRNDSLTFNEVKTASSIIDNWTWQYGAVGSNFNTRGLSEIENGAGKYITVAFRPDPGNTEEFNFIAWTNTFYRPNLVITYELASSGAPTCKFGALKKDIVLTEVVNFKDSSANTPTTWAWDFDYDKNPGTKTSTVQNPDFTYTQSGTYTVALTVTNSVGSSTKIRSNFIHVYQTPEGNFGYQTNIDQPTDVFFKDSSTFSPTEWFWDFGDGKGTSTSQNPEYLYQAVGIYQVCLIAKNIAGADTICKTVIADTTTALGIGNTKNATASIYPNPTNGMIHFKGFSNHTFELFSIQGTRILNLDLKNLSSATLDLQYLKSGIYFYRLTGNNDNAFGKLIKE